VGSVLKVEKLDLTTKGNSTLQLRGISLMTTTLSTEEGNYDSLRVCPSSEARNVTGRVPAILA
jgi:hypothetical protein